MWRSFITVVFIILIAGTTMAFPNEPIGFQFWRLGMPFEEAEPWLVFIKRDQYAGCNIYEARNSSFFGYRIYLEVSFHRGKLVTIHFVSDEENIKDVWYREFVKRFGEPTEKNDRTSYGGFYSNWYGEKAYVAFEGHYTSTGTSKINVYIEERKYHDLRDSLYHYKGW